MRIAIFTECYLPTINGVVISIETFRAELEKRGHEVFIFAPKTKDFIDKDKEHIFRLPSFTWPSQKNYPLAVPFFSWKIAKKIKELKIDVIHSQHLFTVGNLGLRIARKLHIPFVYTYHTLIAEYTHYVPLFSDISKQYLIALSKNFCNKCDQVITPSPSMAKILVKYGVKKPIEPIPTGIHIEALKKHFPDKVIRAKWDIPENRKILLYLSRIAKEKNIDFLLKSMKKLVERRSKKHKLADVHLLMIGGGPELGFYQEQIKKMGIENYVTFTGMLKNDIAVRYYGAADIFVFPSITETQGIVVSEAMAAGIPVVAVNKMGPSDLVKDNEDGFLTDLNQTEFTDRIEQLLDSTTLREKMGLKGTKNAEEFSSEACALKLEKIYNLVIQNFHSKSD
ncbi:MAG: glycosyltransferase family 4 protein [Candidatus Berkelbacteria bacterium]